MIAEIGVGMIVAGIALIGVSVIGIPFVLDGIAKGYAGWDQ